MTLFKLACRNIKRSIKDYAIYFFTLIIGVSIFYVFNAIEGQAAMLAISASKRNFVKLLNMAISGVSVFVAIVLALLIVYASRFLMKRRNKEFAMYMMLGMGKGKISALLVMETVLIGLLSLVVGLLLGVGISQIMSAVVVNMFEANVTAYSIMVSFPAIIKTIVYFACMYVAVLLFNGFSITRMKLITLINSGRREESVKFKNPILCIIVFVIAAIGLGYAYYSVCWDYSSLDNFKFPLVLLIGMVTTFFIFWSLSGLFLRFVMSMKKKYYRGLNTFTFRQISSKVNTVVFSMTAICLMLFVTICTLSSAFYLRNALNNNLNSLCPADAEVYVQNMDTEDTEEIPDLAEVYKSQGLDITTNMKNYVHFRTYKDANLTFRNYLHDAGLSEQGIAPGSFNPEMECVGLSDYNRLMELYGREKLSLEEGQYLIVTNYKETIEMYNAILEKRPEARVFGNTLVPAETKTVDGFISLSVQETNTGFFVVPDSVVAGRKGTADYFIGNYEYANKEELTVVDEKFSEDYKLASEGFPKNSDGESSKYYRTLLTRSELKDAATGLGVILTFIGLYIGVVFLIACGALLALKELSQAVDSIPHYDMLRKIGASEDDIFKSLRRQSGVFFLFPLLLAIVHSIFGMKFAMIIMQFFATEGLEFSILTTSVIMLAIYGGYYLITYLSSKRIISNRI